jgi:putative methionine-R-sulfoxide reductase with GAF domain
MDHYSILDPGFSHSQAPNPAQIGWTGDISQDLPKIDALQCRPEVGVREERASSRMRVPREENTGSLADMALDDLDAMLQLLAERAEYITRATGAAIALWEGDEMVCRASAGASAPALGARLQVDSGLSGESVRTLQTLRCDDAETDSRVNRESCRALGIASVVVLPLVREQEVRGLFELFSDQAYAFAPRDLEALERLGGMVDTALQHADAARANPGVLEAEPIAGKLEAPTIPPRVAQLDFQAPPPSMPVRDNAEKGDDSSAVALPKDPHPPVSASTPVITRPKPASVPALANIRKCETCGFPVSESRTLCLDCEARAMQTLPINRGSSAHNGPELSLGGQLNTNRQDWIVENRYVVSAVVLFVMVLIAMLLSHSS